MNSPEIVLNKNLLWLIPLFDLAERPTRVKHPNPKIWGVDPYDLLLMVGLVVGVVPVAFDLAAQIVCGDTVFEVMQRHFETY